MRGTAGQTTMESPGDVRLRESLMQRVSALLAVIMLSPAKSADAPNLTAANREQLAAHLRSLFLKNLPNPLYEASPNWGHQSDKRVLPLRGRLRDLNLQMNHEPRNEGVWRKIRVDAVNPAETLALELRSLSSDETGRLHFQIAVGLDIKFDITQQRWVAGIKLFDGSARGRARIGITVDCDATSRWEPGVFVPELVIDLKVTKADLLYDNLKLDHIAGLGGEAAEIIGETAQTLVRQWKPSIERDLLERANAAIVKAGEHREVRLSLGKMLAVKSK